MMFKRKLLQRFLFAIYISLILFSLFEIYNIFNDYFGYLERIINYSKWYFLFIQVLIIIVLIDEVIKLTEKDTK